MDIFSIIVATLLGLLITLVSALLFLAIIFNMKRGRKYRQALAKKVAQLRLNKMLVALGVDTNAYIHEEHVADIYQHMERCEECSNTEECDDALSKDKINPDEIGFCNNEQSLQEIAESQATAHKNS
jgi:hypothetical protein